MSGEFCDVCNATPVVGVCCSSLGACSFAYCRTCLECGAEPYRMVVVTVALEGGDVFEKFHESFAEMAFASVLRAGKTSAQFWDDVREETCRQLDDFAKMNEVTP